MIILIFFLPRERMIFTCYLLSNASLTFGGLVSQRHDGKCCAYKVEQQFSSNLLSPDACVKNHLLDISRNYSELKSGNGRTWSPDLSLMKRSRYRLDTRRVIKHYITTIWKILDPSLPKLTSFSRNIWMKPLRWCRQVDYVHSRELSISQSISQLLVILLTINQVDYWTIDSTTNRLYDYAVNYMIVSSKWDD